MNTVALLTRDGLKPKSRWEKPPAGRERELPAGMGLIAGEVRRTVKVGKLVVETLFALSRSHIETAERRFAGRPIGPSRETTRLEGFLFGYPPGCVEQYVKQPYAPSDQPDEIRTILLHWPCRNCRITPLLLPTYRAISATVARIH